MADSTDCSPRAPLPHKLPLRTRAVLSVYDGEGHVCGVALLDREDQSAFYGSKFELDEVLTLLISHEAAGRS